jgi:hypothetical protein
LGARTCASIAVMIVLMATGFSQAEQAVRIEPLDGTHSHLDASSGRHLQKGLQESQVPAAGQRELSGQPRAPFAEPVPPNRLTPAPVLPFHPNRSLMPAPMTPMPFSGGGRVGR